MHCFVSFALQQSHIQSLTSKHQLVINLQPLKGAWSNSQN